MTPKNKNIVSDGFHRRRRRYMSVTLILTAAVLSLCTAIMLLGNTVYSPAAVWKVLTGENIKGAFIYLLSRGGKFEGGRLILIGLGVQAMLNAFISYLLLRAPQHDVPAAYRWLSGSLNGVQLSDIPMLAIIIIIFSPITILLGKHLRILELGENSAVTLGVNTDRTRILLTLSAVISIAFATATTGPIAFVSFLSGPISSKLVGAGTQNELPAGLVGAVLVLLADLIGQFAFNTKFPVGVITGILGAPYLIFLLIRMNKTGGAS